MRNAMVSGSMFDFLVPESRATDFEAEATKLIFRCGGFGCVEIKPGMQVDVLYNHVLCGIQVVTVDPSTKTFEAWVPGVQTAKTFHTRDIR